MSSLKHDGRSVIIRECDTLDHRSSWPAPIHKIIFLCLWMLYSYRFAIIKYTNLHMLLLLSISSAHHNYTLHRLGSTAALHSEDGRLNLVLSDRNHPHHPELNNHEWWLLIEIHSHYLKWWNHSNITLWNEVTPLIRTLNYHKVSGSIKDVPLNLAVTLNIEM